MPSLFDQFTRASFGGIEFAYTKISISGDGRLPVHQFSGVKGGAQEPQGRNLYKVSIDAVFDQGLLHYVDYPGTVAKLIDLFEQQKVEQLSVPHRVPIFARCANWDSELSVRIRSGERMHLVFLEDMQDDLDTSTRNFQYAAPAMMDFVLEQSVPVLFEAAASTSALDRTRGLELADILNAMSDAVDIMATPGNIIGMAGAILANRAASVVNLCLRAYDIALVQAPGGFGLAEAIRAVWLSAQQAVDDHASKRRRIFTWTVRSTQSVGQLSLDIYKTSKYVEELLQANSFDDDQRIPAGSKVFYFEAK